MCSILTASVEYPRRWCEDIYDSRPRYPLRHRRRGGVWGCLLGDKNGNGRLRAPASVLFIILIYNFIIKGTICIFPKLLVSFKNLDHLIY